MFGLPLYSEFIQGSALRTWDCVAQIAAFLWYKFASYRQPITMPRSRRRHHSKSRSRSRSHSHDRDREPKRRKIESYDSPHHRKSVSSEPEANQNADDQIQKQDVVVASVNETTTMDIDCGDGIHKQMESVHCNDDTKIISSDDAINDESTEIIKDASKLKATKDNAEVVKETNELLATDDDMKDKSSELVRDGNELNSSSDDDDDTEYKVNETIGFNIPKKVKNVADTKEVKYTSELKSVSNDTAGKSTKLNSSDDDIKETSELKSSDEDPEDKSFYEKGECKSETDTETPTIKDLKITPKKVMSPKQVQKRMESEKKRLEKLKERDEREKKRLEKRDERNRAKEQLRIEKEGQRLKEKEQRDKEKEMKLKEKELRDKEKEMKRKEKEEKEEQKRKEREFEKSRKQQEIDEKNKEKLKLEELKQKEAAAFVNFFVPKKSETEDKIKENISSFMPFEIKSDMRLAPLNRRILSTTGKEYVVNSLEKQEQGDLYLFELKHGKVVGKDGKTWIYDDGSDDVTILDDLGESIVEQKSKMKVKFLKFHENERPPYYGTWRKTSKHVKPRKPLGMDSDVFNYEIDSDDEWEYEEGGEDIVGSDEEDKENESENDNDYEVDNDVFVPHGHLSDDEVDGDGEDEVFDPEAQKAKLKFMNTQFEEEMKSKTAKIKPRVLGCIWYEDDKKVDEAISRYLQPLSVICSNTVVIRKRSELILTTRKHSYQGLDKEYMPDFLRLLHGNTCKKKLNIVDEYLDYLNKKNLSVSVHKYGMAKQLKECAQWRKCPVEGPMFKVPCWYVSEEVQRDYNVKLELPKRE